MVAFPATAYYHVKPFLPRRLRLALRRINARRVLRHCGDVWPINESAGRRPEAWPGWPHNKQFAFVLTHDVESRQGLENVRVLAELEMQLGFRSSFNFVPEGEYALPRDLRDWLTRNGFEVGVHDLHHDGKLYLSHKAFRRKADRINHYLRNWNAVGFRSGFMMRNLDWLGELDIQYDASTFDTDPFEPQSEGMRTIFPFWVVRNGGNPGRTASSVAPRATAASPGYVELPYTLIQDYNLFVVLQKKDTEIWRRKLSWIVDHAGMALLNTHPDYMSFGPGAAKLGQFPVAHYTDFLRHVRQRYANAFWSALPKEVATYHGQSIASGALAKQPQKREKSNLTVTTTHRKTIWIDLDNTPHIPFFKPIARELERRGFSVVFTARDAFQVCELADAAKLKYIQVGRHHGKNSVLKILGIMVRAVQLAPVVWKHKPDLGLSHGSRSQILLCNFLRIPSVMIMDYEHAKPFPFSRPKWEIVPEVLSSGRLLCPEQRIRAYVGIKEDVYAPEFKPDETLLPELGLLAEDLVVTVRPPATEAHYHNPESELLFAEVMNRLMREKAAKVVLLPRNKRQAEAIKASWPQWFTTKRVIIPKHAVDGLNLLWHSDLVVSGGGTMNREAAALGVPVYSIFRGPIGAVDRQLSAQGRLVLIQTVEEVNTRIHLQRREKVANPNSQPSRTLMNVVEHIEEIVDLETKRSGLALSPGVVFGPSRPLP